MGLNNHILTIAIPTYNRHEKLMRLLVILKEEIVRLDLTDTVSILISDNSENNVTEEPASIIKNILKYPKISIYVLRKVDFTETQNLYINQSIGQGWIFLTISFSVLELNNHPSVAIISEQLASADEDYKHIWVPSPFLHMHKIAFHPYIVKYLPDLHKQLKVDGYIQCIVFSWALKRGILLLDDMEGLNQFINKLEWRLRILLVRPKLFLQFLLMKFNVIPQFLIQK